MKWEYLEDATAISDIVFSYFEKHSKTKGFAYEISRIQYVKDAYGRDLVCVDLVIAPKEYMLKTSYNCFSLDIPLPYYDGIENTELYALLNRTYGSYLNKRN